MLLLASVAAAPVAARDARPDWGKVTGWVIDARTRRPAPGARVRIEVNSEFPDSGKSVAVTDETGRFRAEMPLGRVSSRLDWGRVLTMHPLSLLISPKSALKETRLLDVTYANIHVEAAGYRPFRGRVRAALLDPGKFAVELEDVWLASLDGPGASFSPERFRPEVIEALTVEPAVARPGERVKVTLTARLPVQRDRRYRAYLTSSAIRLVEDQLELKQQEVVDQGDQATSAVVWSGSPRVTFTREIALPQRPLESWSELGFFLVRDDRLLLRQSSVRALLQVAEEGPEQVSGQQIAEGFAWERLARRAEALQRYERALEADPGSRLALRRSAALLQQLGRPAEALARWERLAQLQPGDAGITAAVSEALIAAGRTEEALQRLGEPPGRGVTRSAAARWRLQHAHALALDGSWKKVDEELARAAALDQALPARHVGRIHMLRLEQAVAEQPDDPDLLQSYAAALEADDRPEEAAAALNRAAGARPDDAWLLADLGRLLIRSERGADGILMLRKALELDPDNIEALLLLAESIGNAGDSQGAGALYRRAAELAPLDPRSRLGYGLMLLASHNEPDAEKELRAALDQARSKGELKDPGIIGFYFGPKKRLAAGFSLPEAGAAGALLDALAGIRNRPDEALFHQNAGHALLELSLPQQALPHLRQAFELAPELLETRYLLGVALAATGDAAGASVELKAVIESNPLHPRARLDLARLLAEEGDDAAARLQILEQMKHYPLLRTTPAGG